MINVLEDNYSSEEELKEIISSEKQRKRSGGGHIKDGKTQHRENTRDHRIRHNDEYGNIARLIAKSDGNAGQIGSACLPRSPVMSTSPCSSKMASTKSKPSLSTGTKPISITTSSTTSNAAGTYWQAVSYRRNFMSLSW